MLGLSDGRPMLNRTEVRRAMTAITCPACGASVELDEVLERDIEARVSAAEQERHQAALRRVREEAEREAQAALAASAELAEAKRKHDVEMVRQRLQAELAATRDREAQQHELALKRLVDEAERAREAAKGDAEEKAELRQQIKALTEELRAARKAREQAELAAAKKVADEEAAIRQDARKAADEEHRLRQAEVEKKLADTQKALAEAQRKAEQGSQQSQGEVLELDMEAELRAAFPYDDVVEVKKGQRGADIVQTVRNTRLDKCGLLLWETKNAQWQASWTAKFRQDIRDAGADVGVLVSVHVPEPVRDVGFGLVDDVWVAKPGLALTLGAAMRTQIIHVHQANTAAAAKDERMEMLYQFLIGPEFRHRVESIVENYELLQREIEKEKRAAALRWAKQEKAIRAVVDNTLGMYGALQGIAGSAMGDLLELEAGGDDDAFDET